MVFNLSRFHVVPEISHFDFGEEMLDALLSEAVNRGARDLELIRLMDEYERDHMISSGIENGTGGRSWGADFRLTLDPELIGFFRATKIMNVVNAYNAKVNSEFSSFPKIARDGFGSSGNYFKMRPSYYQYGYSTASETIFSKIDKMTFLDHKVVGGLHEKLRTRLPAVERTLNEWSPGLSAQIAKEIKSIEGFVPRFIASKEGERRESPKLSNHAFGLAIDIDSDFNPHIKDRSVIDVLKQITGYDFGKSFNPGEGGIDITDIAVREWQNARDASKRLREWLGKYLPEYEANSKSCQELDADTALQLDRIRILLKYHSLKELKQWAQHGIISIPLVLAAAMKKNGLRWGEDYKTSKDSMHFELLAEEVLPLDHPPRSVQDLLKNPAAAAIKAGHKKRRAVHR